MAGDFDPYHKWLGIPPEEQPPNHYRLLGITPFEDDPDVIEAAADQRMRHLRTYQSGKHAELCGRLLNEVSAAKVCLLKPDRKAAYDAILRHQLQEAEGKPSPFPTPQSASPLAHAPSSKLAVPEIDTSSPTPPARPKPLPWPVYVGIGVGILLVAGLLLVVFRDGNGPSGKPAATAQDDRTTKRPGTPAPSRKPTTWVPPFDPDRVKTNAEPTKVPQRPAKHQAAEKPPTPTYSAKQTEWAERHGVPLQTTNSIGMKLVLIPPGEFDMGSTEEEVQQLLEQARELGLDVHKWYTGRIPAEAPKHHVRITRAFYLGQYEVTLGQFRQFVEATGYQTDAENSEKGARGFVEEARHLDYRPEFNWRDAGFAQDEDHPVLNVSWNDAAAFCQWLSSKEGKPYRLPTEAEWEYACRAGTSTRFYGGDAVETLRGVANLCDASCDSRMPSPPGQWAVPWDDGYPFTAPVGRFQSNAFGLCDMHGNVPEWCQDWDDGNYYKVSPLEDPPGPESGVRKISRGGGWSHFALCARAAYRSYLPPDSCHNLNGFRVALTDRAPPVIKRKRKQLAAQRTMAVPAKTDREQAPFEPQPEQSATQRRTPVPGPTEQEQGLVHFTAIYGTEWNKARSPSEKQVLATRLLAEARRTKGTTPDDFVLLEKTREIATEAGDTSVALQAIDELGGRFDVDILDLKATAITDLAKTARLPDQRRSLVQHALAVIDDALRSEDFDVAKKLGELAHSVAIRLRDRDLAKQIAARNDEVTELSEAYGKATKARATLKENPDDPQANLSVGSYLCLMRGDWDTGLPYLAKGRDEPLKAVANQELGNPTQASDQVRLADAWWDLAEASKSTDKDKFLDRAGYWYKEAERSARSALEKRKILSRLTEISKIRYPNPDQQLRRGDALPTGLWIDVLRYVRLHKDRMTGEWMQTAQGLAVGPSVHPRVALPVTVDGEYDLEVGFIRTKGSGPVSIFLPVGSSNCVMQFGALSGPGTVNTLSRVDGGSVRDHPTQSPITLVNGQPYVATIRVRLQDERANIEVLLSGRPVLQWSGKQASLASAWAPGGGRPALSALRTTVIFTSARLRVVSGEARLSELKSGIAPDAGAYLNVNSQGLVSEIDTASLSLRREIILAEDQDVVSGRGGIFNALAGIAIHPAGARALVVGMHANSRRGRVLSGRTLSHKTTVQAATRVLDLQNGQELPNARMVSSFSGQVVAVPAAVAFIGPGAHFIEVYFASNDLKVLEYNEKGFVAERALLALPHGPTGVALTRDAQTAFVLSRWDRSISELRIAGVRKPTVVKTVRAVEEPWDEQRIRGAILFHGTRDPRMTAFRWMSCGVCHLEGGLVSDGLVWDLTVGDAPPKLSDTMDLVNTPGTSPPFFHRGLADPAPALERFATIFQGGTGFLDDGHPAHTGPTAQSGDSAATSADAAKRQEAWASVLAYIDGLRPRPNPHMDGELPRPEIREAAGRGRAIFFDEKVGCSRCHNGPRWTVSGDPDRDSLFPVGTGKNLDTPSLDHLWDTAPYLHDGRAQTLEEVFTKHNRQDMHGKTSHLSQQQLSDLISFLLAPFHDESPPPKGNAP